MDPFSLIGSHGASKHLEIIAFPVVEKAIQYIRQDLLCRSIVGLIGSIPDGYEHAECALNGDDTKFFVACDANRGSTGRRSIPLDKISFVEGNICFAIDKERHGLPLSLSQLCDVLIHVPHLPISGQLPLFNTPICLSILLDSFARSSGFLERNFQGQKFSVARPRTEYIDGSDVVNASSFPITKGCPTEAEDVFDGLRAAFPGNRETCDY